VAWDISSVGGVYRFLNRIWNLAQEFMTQPNQSADQALLKIQHKTIKKVTDDLTRASFNTAVAALMEYLNALTKQPAKVSRENLETLLKLLAPFAPHITSELFEQLGNKQLIDFAGWPKWDEKLTTDDEITIGVQVNGKLRGEITIARTAPEDSVKTKALELDTVQNQLKNHQPTRVIYIPERIVNIVV
jgi:leucyl-tRNA synthetase